MKEEMFKELLESVRQAGAIKRGEMEPSRVFEAESPDVKSIRAKLGVSQTEFASLLGISVRTLENWEQKRRIPKGPARVLLEVAAAHPDAVWDVVRHASKDRKRAVRAENRVS
jgi:putative transcriptional regulator